MPKLDLKQGSADWMRARLGIPTASDFSKIITPKTIKLSSQYDDYANLKIAEIMTGEMQGMFTPNYYMERGQLMELEARESYEFTHSVITEDGGFWTDKKHHFGASPDFMVGNDGCGEIKCLDGKQHVKYLVENKVKDEFMPQIMGQLLITEREWCDWWLYHPQMPRLAIRIYRDEKYIKTLSECLEIFRDKMSEKIEDLEKRGLWQVAMPII